MSAEDDSHHTTKARNNFQAANAGKLGPRNRSRNALVQAAVAEREAAKTHSAASRGNAKRSSEQTNHSSKRHTSKVIPSMSFSFS